MDDLNKLLSDLVAIDSTNPDLVPGAAGEEEIAQFIAGWMERAGLEVRIIEAAPPPLPAATPRAGRKRPPPNASNKAAPDDPITRHLGEEKRNGVKHRPNVVGIAHGTGGGRTLLLNGHMDTVSKGDFAAAHMPRVENGRLYGRGAYDMKGGLAACMAAAAEAKKQRLRGDVIVTAVADEEYASIGTAAIAKAFKEGTLTGGAKGANDGQPWAAIVAEFTELQVILAHKGFIWFEIETTGRAAHGSRPDLGVDAIEQMGNVLVELKHLNRARRAHPSHPLLGTGSLHASLIHGGQELSSYPEHCTLSVEIRTLPGETPEQVEAKLRDILEQQERLDPTFRGELRRSIDRSPLETPGESGIAQAVQRAATKVLGHPAPVAGVPFWTDAALLSEAGIPSLLYGPSGAGAHAAEEWVDLASVEACARVYLEAAREWGG